MKVFGSLSRVVSAIFLKDSQAITLQPSQSVTYTAARTVQFPPEDANSVLVSAAATQTLSNKTIDAASNTISNIANANVASAAAIAVNKLAAVTASRALASDASGFVSASATTSAELAFVSGVTSAIQTQLNATEKSANKGVANGYASLDGGGKVPVAQLPNSIMEFQGVWNASTNSPTLVDGTGNTGDVYRVNVAGTQNLGSGSQTFVVGDWAVYDAGGIWRLAHAGADAVVSVNGSAGVVTVNAINQLTSDVTTSAASGSQSLAATIANNVVTNAKLAQMAANTVKANSTGSTANASDVALTSAATASAVMIRDANANVQSNNLVRNFATTATAAGTTVLTVSSPAIQQFTGSTTQNVNLPNATTLILGYQFEILNRSTGVVTVRDATPTTVLAMAAGSSATFTVTNIGSAAGTWDVNYTLAGASTVTSVNGSTGVVTVNAINQLTGDVTAGPASGSASAASTIAAGAIVDSKVSASAAIAVSKLAALTASRAVATNVSGVLTPSATTDTELGFVSGVTSAIQTQLNAKQPLDSDLTAIAALSTNGIIVRTGTGTAATRTLVAGTNITLSNADGVAGDITINSTATVSSFKTNWITADGTTKVVTHSLGSTDVIVQVFDATNGETIYMNTVVRTSTSVVTLNSSEAPGASGWRVLILAI